MFKKLLVLVAFFSLASCGGKSKKDQVESEEMKIEDQAADALPANSEPYQTVENEQQAQVLNQEAQTQVQEVEVQDRVFFGYDSAELTDEAKKILDTQVSWLKSDTGVKVIVEGHCDERGTREYNIALGEKRANAAKNYLVQNGVDGARIKTISYGKERPAYFGTNEDIMSKNRRAVTVVN